MEKHTCRICSKPLNTGKQFCSISCSNKYWNSRRKRSPKPARKGDELLTITRICPKCGTEFSVTRPRSSLSGKNIPSFCSRACANARTHSEETKHKISAGIYRSLENNPGYVRKPVSPRPARERQYPVRNLADCVHCGAPVPFGNKKFCSQTCRDEHTTEGRIRALREGERLTGIAVRTLKQYVMKIQGPSCAICGTTEWCGQPVTLILDHIDGHAYNHVLSNMRLLCSNCDAQLPTYKSKNKNSDRSHRRLLAA